MKLNFIWCLKSDEEVNFSHDWIMDTFSDFEITEHFDLQNNFNHVLDNSIIFWCKKERDDKFIDYLKLLNSQNINYTVFHLSDEDYSQNIDFYTECKKILRHYYKESYSNNYNILTLPLGYKSGLAKVNANKEILYNFIGQPKSDRHTMLQLFSQLNGYTYLTSRWNDPNALNINQYSEILSKSYFTLSPRGWVNLDSFRINEALECDSIPVTLLDYDNTDYFAHIYGEHPFIIGTDWNEVYKIVSSMSNEDIINKYNEVKIWYSNYKIELKEKIKNFII